MNVPNAAIRKSLLKLFAWAILLIGLAFAFLHVNRDFAGVIGGFAVLVALPATILSCVDASRVIRRADPASKNIRILGFALGLPQAVLGAMLLAYGLIYPYFGISDIVSDVAMGRSAIVPFVRTATAFFFLGVGYYYVREGLRLDKTRKEGKRKNQGRIRKFRRNR